MPRILESRSHITSGSNAEPSGMTYVHVFLDVIDAREAGKQGTNSHWEVEAEITEC